MFDIFSRLDTVVRIWFLGVNHPISPDFVGGLEVATQGELADCVGASPVEFGIFGEAD